MRRFSRRSLRVQLAILGFVAILVPIVVLLTVVFATSSEEVSTGVVRNGDGTTSFDLEVEDVSETTTGVSPWVSLTALGLAVPAAVAVWWWSGRAVAPLADITAVADEIQAGSLDRRIGLTGAPVEVQSLGDSFDRMLARLSTASTTQQELIEDTSHELRTPLAALAINSEVMLANQQPTLEDYRASTERTDALVARIQTTIDELLLGARARSRAAQQVDNDLMAIVHRVADHQRALTPQIVIDVTGPPSLRLGIDGPSVERAISNLVDNAARFSPADQPVELAVTAVAAEARLVVTDHGPGISEADKGRIFDRYFQGEGETGEGRGIGLAIVRQVADAHGRVEVESPVDANGGTRFTMVFAR